MIRWWLMPEMSSLLVSRDEDSVVKTLTWYIVPTPWPKRLTDPNAARVENLTFCIP